MSGMTDGMVQIESHWLQNIASAAALLEGTGSLLDKREADALRKLLKSAKPVADRLRGEAAPDGQAVATHCQMDHELVWPNRRWTCRHCGHVVLRDSSDGHPHVRCRPQAALSSTAAPAPVAGDAVQLPEGAPPHWGDAMSVLEAAAPAELQPLIFNVAYACDQRLSFLHMRVRDLEAALAQDRASQGAPSAHYSIDADPDGIRARVADAITGALSFGAQGAHKPPAGHWLEPFWDIALAEREATVPPTVDEATARRLDDYLGGEFDIRIGKQAAQAALVHALAQDRASQAAAPVGVVVELTDEIVERAFDAWCDVADVDDYRVRNSREALRAALTAALRTGGGE